jgi:transcription termination factor Rho
VIFEEFKGTGNWELWLDRRLAEKRVYPSIDIQKSGTRRDDLLLDEETHKRIVLLRRMTSLVNQSQNSSESAEMILDRLSRTETNADFLQTLKEAI